MAPSWKPLFKQLRRVLIPLRNRLCDQLAKGRILVHSEESSVKACDLVLRLLSHMSTEGEDPALLATAIAEVKALRDQQLAQLAAARSIVSDSSDGIGAVTTAEAVAAGLAA